MPSASLEYIKNHEIVRAGAGAGKTYTLTHKVMEIAEEHLKKTGHLPRIIVTTFTRKATQELRERLMLLALEEKPHLVDFVNSRSHLVVSTMHGVMDLYLKRYGANICVDPSYKVMSGPEASKIARQVMRQILLSNTESEVLLQDFQFNRLVSLARQLDQALAENPEASPFQREDFEKIFEAQAPKVLSLLESSARVILAETDKASWVEIAEGHQKLAALLKSGTWEKYRESYLRVLTDQKTIRRPGRGQAPVSGSTIDLAKEARAEADNLSEPIYDPANWSLFAERFESFSAIGKKFSEDFRKEKLDRGALEISDLEMRAMQCILSHPETVDAFWREWDHWLIDEYQDTSPFQVELIKHLAGESPCFVVGDPQQSIYLFRGARSEVFGEKEQEILQGGGMQRFLKMNRRSQPELLLFLNDFFSVFDPPFSSMEPFIKEDEKVDPDKIVATFYINEPQAEKEDSKREDSEEVSEDAGDSTTDSSSGSASGESDESSQRELDAIVTHIQELRSKGVRFEDICVLGRTNGQLTEVANHLSRFQLPVHVHAASGFYDRREVSDALAFFKFLINPHDNFNTVELLRSPWFRVPDSTLAPLTKAKPASLWEVLVSENSMSDEFSAVRRLLRYQQDAMSEGLTEVFQRALVESGFVDLSHTHDVSGRRESNIWKLVNRLRLEETKPGFNPLEFIAGSMTDLKEDTGNAEGDAVAAVEPNRINLMTVHASKGLEFDHVVLPKMHTRPRLTSAPEFTYDEITGKWAIRVPVGEDRDFLGSLPQEIWIERFKKHELEEHARVLYVALTRAVKSIFLSWTEPREKNSWASMIKMDLNSGFHQKENYRYQVVRGHLVPKAANAEVSAHVDIRDKWKKESEHSGALGVIEGAQNETSMSVTDILDRKIGVKLVSSSNQEIVSRLKVAAEGTAVHRLMELLKYPSRTQLERLIKKWFPEKEDQVLQAIEFVRQLQEPNLLEIIHSGEVEWGFAIVEDGILIEGQVDAWGRDASGGAWIIDYKTGSTSYREKAFEQMALYAFALRKSGLLKPDEKLTLAAIYPFEEKVFIESEPPMAKVRAMLGLKT